MEGLAMHILIDNQKSVEVSPEPMIDGNELPQLVLSFDDTALILEAWKDLDPAHRSYRYGRDESDMAPSTIIIAWVDGTGALAMNDVDPFWDGSEHNAYALDALDEALAIDMLLWGERIGEPAL